MAKRRAGVGVVALNGYLYAVGGFDDASPLDTVERWGGMLMKLLPLYIPLCLQLGVVLQIFKMHSVCRKRSYRFVYIHGD